MEIEKVVQGISARVEQAIMNANEAAASVFLERSAGKMRVAERAAIASEIAGRPISAGAVKTRDWERRRAARGEAA